MISNSLYPLYTGAATFLPALCDHKTGQVAVEGREEAERLPWSLNGGTQDVQTSPWTPWSPWSFEHVQTVAQRSPRRAVTHRSLEGGRRKAHTSPWWQNGCTMVGHWSPRKKYVLLWIWATLLPSLYHHYASFGRPIASIERSQWRQLCLHSATTATLQTPWQWFCLHSASFVRPVAPLQQIWSFKEGTRVLLQQLHRNRTFWVWATTERPGHFSGRSKVARRSQPCVKGALDIDIIQGDIHDRSC